MSQKCDDKIEIKKCLVKQAVEVCTIVVLLIVVLLIVISPVIINELYKMHDGYLTLWEAKDMLQYVITSYTFVGTITLGGLTLYINNKLKNANERMANINEKMILITNSALIREERAEIPLLDFVVFSNGSDEFKLKAEFLCVDNNARIRLWMNNPQNYGIQSATVKDAVLGIYDQNVMAQKFEIDLKKSVRLIEDKSAQMYVSILPKRERIFALSFPWKREFSGKNIYILQIIFENKNNFGQTVIEKLNISFEGICDEQLCSKEHWPFKLYSHESYYKWLE